MALIAGVKSVIEFYEKKEKLTNKENDKHEDVHSVLHNTTSSHTNVCTKFQNPGCNSSCEICDKNLIGEKRKMDK